MSGPMEDERNKLRADILAALSRVYTEDAERIEKLCEEHDISEYELIQILLDAAENGDIEIY